jgi:hypothetical protein
MEHVFNIGVYGSRFKVHGPRFTVQGSVFEVQFCSEFLPHAFTNTRQESPNLAAQQLLNFKIEE